MKIEEMRDYLKLRGRTKWVAEQSGYPYPELLRFLSGKTNDPRASNIQKLSDFIEKDRAEFGRLGNE